MNKKHLKLGDLVSLEGLEKPVDGVVLGGGEEKTENVNKLEGVISGFAGTLEDNKNVQVGEIAGLVEATKNAMKRVLSAETASAFLSGLRRRFESKDNGYDSIYIENSGPGPARGGLEWAGIQKALEADPEKLWSLYQMADTGGRPDVLMYDSQTKEYVFCDFALETPKSRRNCAYNKDGLKMAEWAVPSTPCNGDAISMAELMGVDLLSEHEYYYLQNERSTQRDPAWFDRDSWIWLKTPIDKIDKTPYMGRALTGKSLHGAMLSVDKEHIQVHMNSGGWRAVLRFKAV